MFKKNKVILSLCVIIGVYLIYLLITDKSPVELTTIKLMHLERVLSTKYPKTSIKEYRVITKDVVKSGLMPKEFIKNGDAKNVWGGNIIIQLFPENSWGAGVGATINYILGSVPQKDCFQMVKRLGRQSSGRIYQIKIEPIKKVYRTFPIPDNGYCSKGFNHIGYTVFAE